MALATTGEQRAVFELIEPFVLRRRADWSRTVRAIAAEQGTSESALMYLFAAPMIAKDGVLTAEAQRTKAIYSTKESWRIAWTQLTNSGLVERHEGDAIKFTSAGRSALERLHLSSQRHLASLSLPRGVLGDCRRELTAVEERISEQTLRMHWNRNLEPRGDAADHDAVRLEYIILILLGHRFDCHITAWRSRGYTGPALDVLTQVWRGHQTFAMVEEMLATKQLPEDIRANIRVLVEGGDLTETDDGLQTTQKGRSVREDIEADTDRNALAPWPTGEALVVLGRNLDTLIAALPEPVEPIVHH